MEKNKFLDYFLEPESVKDYDFLFKPLEFEKISATKVSRSSAAWETDILKKVSEEKPFILEGTDYLIKFKEVDGDRGYGFGSIVVSNVQPQARLDYNSEYNHYLADRAQVPANMQDTAKHVFIPIIIRDFKLEDFDLFVQDGQPRVLTEQNFYRYMSNNDSFGNAAMAPRAPVIYDDTAEKQFPPYGGANRHQTYRNAGLLSYAAAGMKKRADSSVHPLGLWDQLIPTIRACDRKRLEEHVGDERLVAQFAGTPAVKLVDKILKGAPVTSPDVNEVSEDMQPFNIARIKRQEQDLYTVTGTSDWLYKPRAKDYNLTDLLSHFGDKVPELAEKLLTLNIGQEFVITIGHEARPLIVLEDYVTAPEFLSEAGPALALTSGGDIVHGEYLNRVYEPTGELSPGDLFITGDHYAFQKGMIGNSHTTPAKLSHGSLHYGTWGTFMYPMEDKVCALTPFKVLAVSTKEGKVFVRVQDVYGNEISYVIMPGIQKILNMTGNDLLEIGNYQGANAFAIPKFFKFIHLGDRITIQSDPADAILTVNRKLMVHGARGKIKKTQKYGVDADTECSLTIKQSDNGFIMEGPALEPITKDDSYSWIDGTTALYRLVLLGADISNATAILEKVKQHGTITITNCKDLRAGETKLGTAKKVVEVIEEAVGYLNRDLIKEAAEIAKEDSVDSVLSLAFINPENLGIYLENMERLEQAENDLAQLLLLVRLGLDNVNEVAVVNALRNLSDVNEDLRFVNKMMDIKQSAAASQI